MSRKKGVSKTDWAEEIKGSAPGALGKAKHGDDWSMVFILDTFRWVLRGKNHPGMKVSYDLYSKRWWDHLEEAIARKDGSFYRKLADAIESGAEFFKGPPIDPLRDFLIRHCVNMDGTQKRKLTARELAAEYEKKTDGRIDDLSYLRHVCDEMKIDLAPAPTGRPKKSAK